MQQATQTTQNIQDNQSNQDSQAIQDTQSSQLLIIADLSTVYKRVKDTCEAGIYPKLLLSGSRVVVQFEVKIMSSGKRKNLGLFLSYKAAVAAKWMYKKDQPLTRSVEEQRALEELRELNTLSALAEKEEVQAKLLQNKPINMEEISELLKDIPMHEITAEKVIEVNGKSITPAMQSAWLEWHFKQIMGQESMDTTMNPKQNGQSAELSDDEYDKLLGLDD